MQNCQRRDHTGPSIRLIIWRREPESAQSQGSIAVDFALFRLRVAANRNPYGSVVVSHYYAVLQKSGKTQFIFDLPAPETCVNALFPHSGMQPCWYLSRHPEQ